MTKRESTVAALCCLLACSTAIAAPREQMQLRHVSVDLAGPPARVLPTDLDGDGRLDLVVVVGYTEIQQVSEDSIEDMIQFTRVIPTLYDRRQATAYLATGDGGFEVAGTPLELPLTVLHMEPGPAGVGLIALTDDGLSRVRFDRTAGDGPPLRLEPLIADRPVLAGTRRFYSDVDLVHDLDGDGVGDVLLPSNEGLAVYLTTSNGLATSPVQRINPGSDAASDANPRRRWYPIPEVSYVNGDDLPDLVFFRDSVHSSRRILVYLGTGGGRFRPLRADPLDCHDLQTDLRRDTAQADAYPWLENVTAFRDVDGDHWAEAVVSIEQSRGDGWRKEMKDAKKPISTYRFHDLTPGVTVQADPYFEMEVIGYDMSGGFDDDSDGDNEGSPFRLDQFVDLDDDGLEDLVTVTLDFSVFQVVKILATKKLGVGVNFHVFAQQSDGSFREVPGLDLSEKLKLDLNNLKIGRFAQFAGDFDGDGRHDFVHLGRGTTITIHRGQPGCNYPAKPDLSIELSREPDSLDLVRIEDLDGDGRSDIRITRPMPMDDPRRHRAGENGPLPQRGATMTARPVSWLLAVFLAAGMAGAAGDPDTPRTGVTVERSRGSLRLDAVLPGQLISYALPLDPSGRRDVMLLVRPHDLDDRGGETTRSSKPNSETDDADDTYRKIPPCPAEDRDGGSAVVTAPPLALYRLDVGAERLELLREDLPHDATALDAIDLDGDGRQELIVARPGEVLHVGRSASQPLVTLLERDGLDWSSLHPRSVRHEALSGRPWTTMTELGRLTLYGPAAGQTDWSVLAQVDLPLEAEVERDGISIWSPSPLLVGDAADGTLFFASSPKSFGKSRVQTTLVAIRPDGESSITDCWARLPAPEDVLDSSFLFVDDRPMLMLTTKPGDKLNLFGEKLLRIYPLVRDRSRLGLLPMFEVETRINLWQDTSLYMLDVNDDGRDDLVIGYWKGILKDRVVLDAYLRTAEGGFEKAARNTAFDVNKGDRDFVQYGADLTGNGYPDLLVRGKKGLVIYPGRHSKNGSQLVEDKPIVVQLTEREKESEEDMFYTYYTGARPQAVDLDADGRHDVLLIYTGDRATPGIFRLVRRVS